MKKSDGAIDLDWEGLGVSDTQAKFLRLTMFRDLVSEKPAEVFQRLALSDFSREFQSLEGNDKSRLSQLIVEVDRGWSRELKEAAIVHLLENGRALRSKGTRETHNSLGAIVSQHVHSLMTVDSRQATHWVSNLPESPIRLEAKLNLARNWRNLDPESAKKWIATQPGSERVAIEEGLGTR